MSPLSLEKEIAVCDLCPLAKTRVKAVPGKGPFNSRLMLVGEGPGKEEDLSGEPFVGRAGHLLEKILDSVGFQRGEVFITNIVKCRPPGNRDPEREEIAKCTPFLTRQVEWIKPDIVITLGRFSMRFFLGENCQTISKEVGGWHEKKTPQGHPFRVVPFFHPAYLLRNPTKKVGGPKSITWELIKKVRSEIDLLGGPLK